MGRLGGTDKTVVSRVDHSRCQFNNTVPTRFVRVDTSRVKPLCMSVIIALLALVTGLIAGVVFGLLGVPIPAPPELAGVLGIVGIFVGYRLVQYAGVGVDLQGLLGL